MTKSLLPEKVNADYLETGETKRNFRLGVLNGVIYTTADTLLDPNLVLVSFLSTLTSLPLILGMVIPIRDGGWSLPQLWVSGFLQNKHHKLKLYQQMSLIRIICWGSLAGVVNFVRDPTLLLVGFLVAFSIASVTSGIAGISFLEVVGKTIPSDRRGEFFAWRFGLGGIGGICSSLLIRWVLSSTSPLPYPYNYGILTTIFFILASISYVSYNAVHEIPDEIVKPRLGFSQQLSNGYRLLSTDLKFKRLIIMWSCLLIGGTATPFFAWYVQKYLGGNPYMVGIYLVALTVTNLISNYLFGILSKKIGNSKVLVIATISGILMGLFVIILVLLSSVMDLRGNVSAYWLIPVFVLSGIRVTGIGVSVNSLLLEIAPQEERTLYVGFANSLLGVILLLTAAGGLIIDILGFPFLLSIILVVHVIALVNIPGIYNKDSDYHLQEIV